MTRRFSMSQKLTVSRLREIIKEEKKKIKNASTVDTVKDAWSGGDNLVNQIDFIKKLGIKEARLKKRAQGIARARKILKRHIVKDI
jgi:hypothetical protein